MNKNKLKIIFLPVLVVIFATILFGLKIFYNDYNKNSSVVKGFHKLDVVALDNNDSIEPNNVIEKGAKGDGVADDSEYFSTDLDNFIPSGKVCAISISKFNSIHTNYLGEGNLRVLDVPIKWGVKSSHPQGLISPKDMSDQILMDMNLPNEGVPNGAWTNQQISGWYPFDDISMPSEYNYINPWGQIFIKQGLSYPDDSYVYIENLTILCYMKSTQSWKEFTPTTIDGMFFDEDYSSDVIPTPATITKTNNGIKVKIDSSSKGRTFHFYSKAGNPDPSDLMYTVVYCDVYTDSDISDNVFVANVGADYKKLTADQQTTLGIHEVCGSRFINVTKNSRRIYATNLDYNNYFNFCNQELIDSLKPYGL